VWDGKAAQQAGVPFVGLTCGGTPEAELRSSGAIEVWRDPAELVAHIDQSVLATLLTEPARPA
jgi:phosphoglycolate phosphatase-like HAD superfamily hydrolase